MVPRSAVALVALFLAAAESAPNVVFVLFDDVGWADFGYNVGGRSAIPTPNLGGNSVDFFSARKVARKMARKSNLLEAYE